MPDNGLTALKLRKATFPFGGTPYRMLRAGVIRAAQIVD